MAFWKMVTGGDSRQKRDYKVTSSVYEKAKHDLSLEMKLQWEDGTHPMKGNSEKRIALGIHHFQNSEVQTKINQNRIKAGTHNLLGPNQNLKRVEEGTHPSLIRTSCIECHHETTICHIHKHLKKHA